MASNPLFNRNNPNPNPIKKNGTKSDEGVGLGTSIQVFMFFFVPILVMATWAFVARVAFEVESMGLYVFGLILMGISGAMVVGSLILFLRDTVFFPMRQYIYSLFPGAFGFIMVSASLASDKESCKK